MPSLSLLATSPSLLSAALAVATPTPVAEQPDIAPVAWTLSAAQEAPAAPPEETPAPPPEDDAAPVNEILVEGTYGPPKSDPLEDLNEESFRVTQALDGVFLEPVAYAYRDGLPEPIRDGLGNVVRNLGEPSNALNYLLQGKVGKAFKTLGRLAINSTLGIGGLFDVAGKSNINLPYKRNGFANTMGYYGIGPGPYMYLPVTGATTVRDLIGNTLDQALLPFAVGAPFNRQDYSAAYFVVNSLELRLEFDAEIAEIRETDDPYLVRRETYLAQRRREIAALKGKVIPRDEDRFILRSQDPVEPPTPQSNAPVEAPENPEALLITRPR
ncbi:hypothetical protein C0V72_10435 [Porphyrobacter sp. TH134]|nr:hypothetical protein C0V72_10435 [Porphyrobacter sp. TH134]